jgi:MSHA biogenesis protein MshK
MIPAHHGMITVALALMLAPGTGVAQGVAPTRALGDPMRPPALMGAASETAGTPGGMVLQSTIMSRGRRIAMIDGKSMNVGDRIGEARIVAINPDSVTLREAGATRVLRLNEGVEISGRTAAKVPASREGAKEGTR